MADRLEVASPASAARPAHESAVLNLNERRIDLDGEAYTFEEFASYHGFASGITIWQKSERLDSADQPVVITVSPPEDSAAPPVEPQVNAELHDESAHSSSTDASTIPNDDIDPEGDQADPEADQAGEMIDPAGYPIGSEQARELIECDTAADCAQDELDITALEATTSAHDDWLHRGPFLFNVDFHTYMRFAVRRPRLNLLMATDADRAEHLFLFDAHYALADSHWQQLVTEGVSKLVVMEALRCPPPSLNNGEDNAAFKSLIGTLIRCPGPGHCADPLFCKPGFFQVTVTESAIKTHESELPDWIDHANFTPRKCSLRVTRRTHADNVPSTFSCRMQWKARRAEIEVLANQAVDISNDAKRMPVVADITVLRTLGSGSAARPAQCPPTWRYLFSFTQMWMSKCITVLRTLSSGSAARPAQCPPTRGYLLCFTQMWMSKCGQPFPSFANKVLECIGANIHHPHQMSLAQFSAYHLRDVIVNLDMLAVARTYKLTATSKEDIENETDDLGPSAKSAVVTEACEEIR
jgi:hypothetical protein